jgi:hypothetical protein
MSFAAIAGGAFAAKSLNNKQAAQRLRAEQAAYGSTGPAPKYVCPRCKGQGTTDKLTNLENEYDVELGKDGPACHSWFTCIFTIPTLCCFGFLCTEDKCGLCDGKGWIPHFPQNARIWVDPKAVQVPRPTTPPKDHRTDPEFQKAMALLKKADELLERGRKIDARFGIVKK